VSASPGERPAAAEAPARQGTLNRRVPGAQLPVAAPRSPDRQARVRPAQDASAARTAMDAFQSAVASASSPPGTTASAPRLSRRTPGTSLAPALRETHPGTPARRVTAAPQRDPEAERTAFDGYVAGLAEAARQAGAEADHHLLPPPMKEGRK
jgi:hypothetical protein